MAHSRRGSDTPRTWPDALNRFPPLPGTYPVGVRWRTGYNATHVSASVDRGPDGDFESTIYASGHYARWREHGTRHNAPERVMSEYLRKIDPNAQINNPGGPRG